MRDGGAGDLLPDAINDSFTTSVGTPLNGNVMANDSPGDTPASVIAYAATSAQLGTVTMNGAGNFTYTPPASFSGLDSFSYTVGDNDGDSDSATVTVTVNPATGGLSLAVTSSRNKGDTYANLAWSGGNGTGMVAIQRNGVLVIPSTDNDGSWSENLGKGVTGSYTYRVCENSGGACAESTIKF
jgi:hypothetical protein